MRTIWKFEMQVSDRIEVLMPHNAMILPRVHAPQPDILWVWALIPESERVQYVTRNFHVVGTGNPMDATAAFSYVGTAVVGSLVWHVLLEV